MKIYLKEILKNKKMTIKEISKKLNIPYQTFSNYVRNIREPDLETLIKISKFLNVSTDEILLGTKTTNYIDDEKYKKLIEIKKLVNETIK